METNTLPKHMKRESAKKISSFLAKALRTQKRRIVASLLATLTMWGVTAGVGFYEVFKTEDDNSIHYGNGPKVNEYYYLRYRHNINTTVPTTGYMVGKMGENSLLIRFSSGQSTVSLKSTEFDSKIVGMAKNDSRVVNLNFSSNFPAYDNQSYTIALKMIEIIDREETGRESITLQNDDVAILDYEGFRNGVAFTGGKGEYYALTIGSDSFIDGFEDGMIGMKEGEKKDVNVTFPANYSESTLAGQPVVFKVFLRSIIKASQL